MSVKRNPRILARRVCFVQDCDSTSVKYPNLPFVAVPVEEIRRRKWLTAIGRKEMIDQKKMTKHLVCALHFATDTFVEVSHHLRPYAVPSKHLPHQLEDGNDVKKKLDAMSNLSPLDRKRKLLEELRRLEGKRQRVDDKMKKINTQLQAAKTLVTYDPDVNNIIRRFENVIQWLQNMNSELEGVFYNPEFQEFALKFHCTSPLGYRFLKTSINLPSMDTLKTFIFRNPSVLYEQIYETISLKLASLPDKAKYCVICIDALPLNRNQHSNEHEEIPLKVEDGDIKLNIVSSAYVIMIQGIFYEWNHPVGYHFLGSTKDYKELDTWINKVIINLIGAGIQVKAIVSDMDSNFDGYANSKNVSIGKPYFFVENIYKVYYIFDVPHLLKCVRNLLLTNCFSYSEKAISWHYIKSLYENQKKRLQKLIPNITDIHIKPIEDQKKELNYAAEVFSDTMYVALETYIAIGLIRKEAAMTAKFIKLISDVFHLLYCGKAKSASAKQHRNAYTNNKENLKLLQDLQFMLANMKCLNRSAEEDVNSKTSLFSNFQITIQSVQQLFKDLEREGFDHLFTRNLSQGSLEKLFEDFLVKNDSGTVRTSHDLDRAFTKSVLTCMSKGFASAKKEYNLYDILLTAERIMNMVNKKQHQETTTTVKQEPE